MEVKDVSADKVYNLPLFESYLVIDVRKQEEYLKEHIATAVPFPIVDQTDTQQLEDNFAKLIVFVVKDGVPERLSPIILYGDDTQDSVDQIKWLTDRFSRLQHAHIALQNFLDLISDDHFLNHLADFQERLSSSKIWIIQGGYVAFRTNFPLLCGANPAADTPLPCKIADGLFLGARGVFGKLSLDRETFRSLGIQHIIVHSRYRRDVTLQTDPNLI
jgi:rhodanese-related sulfurtransferase